MSRKTRLFIIIALSLIAMFGTLFTFDAAKGFVLGLWYSPKVNNHFNTDFGAINPKLLNDYGITFEHKTSNKTCGPTSGYPSGGKYIFTCRISIRANPVVADEAFIEKWREISPEFEKHLMSEGWQKEWNKAQPIDEILDDFNNSGTIGVNYSKKHDKVTCRLSLKWLRPETPNRLTVDEVCEMSKRIAWGW